MRTIAMSAQFARTAPTARNPKRRGFTLIEVLVVIALTTILLTLVFKPLIDTYNMTSRAGTQINTQVFARETMSEITRILNNAVFVYDNVQTPINIWLPTQEGFQFPQAINPNQGFVQARFGMVQYVLPARQLDQRPGGAPLDPTSGQPIYPPGTTPGQRGYALPLAPGRALGRIFIGLTRNNAVNDTHIVNANFPNDATQNGMPQRPYGNQYEDRLPGDQDNRYTLWKAEVLAYIPDPDIQRTPQPRYVPNLGLFHTYDPVTNDVTDNVNHPIRLNDPNFFYDNSLAGGTGELKWQVPGWRDLNGDGRVQIWENWRAAAVTLMPTNRVDMIALDRDENSNAIAYYDGAGNLTQNSDGRPQARLLATFTPDFVRNDLAAATAMNNAGNESPNPAPTLFKSQYTHWSTPFRVLVYRTSDQAPNGNPMIRNPLEVYIANGSGSIGRAAIASNVNPPDAPPPNTAADIGPWLDATGAFRNANTQFAFTVDPLRGQVNFAFPSSAVLRDPNNNPVPARFSPEEVNNSAFNTLPSGNEVEKRYIDLRFLPQTTWNGFPLNPGILSPLDPSRLWASSVRIVPGSERVVGPDQRPGPNYGYPVVYRRVSALAGTVGKNEYKINYEDVRNANAAEPQDPAVHMGFIEFNSIADAAGIYNIPNENPAGMVYRPNGIPNLRVNRVSGQNEFVLPIEVTFEFQMNRPNDVVKVDYMTRELMNIAIEARLYDARTNAPQSTALTSKVKVRNLQR